MDVRPAENVDLSLDLLPGLRLSNPLMIASSHLTATEAALRNLARVRPSAVTLKTTSTVVGGDGKGRRLLVNVFDMEQDTIGIYSDGPKDLEFLDLAATKGLLTVAKELFGETPVGISVLQNKDENYEALAGEVASCNYVEFNLKYSLRPDPGSPNASYLERAQEQWVTHCCPS
jgi:dihydroorotate dehydrogenase